MKSVAGQQAGQMGYPGNWKRRSDLHVPFQFQTGFIYMRKVFLLLQNHLDIQKYYNMLLDMHTQVSQVCICALLTHYIHNFHSISFNFNCWGGHRCG